MISDIHTYMNVKMKLEMYWLLNKYLYYDFDLLMQGTVSACLQADEEKNASSNRLLSLWEASRVCLS